MADHLNAHEKPPARIREVYKHYQKTQPNAHNDQRLLPSFLPSSEAVDEPLFPTVDLRLPPELRQIFNEFVHVQRLDDLNTDADVPTECKPYQVPNMPGLIVYPNLFPSSIQIALLDKLLHRDIANPAHKTNVHLHHHVSYPEPNTSYFHPATEDLVFQPKDATIHKPIGITQFLNRKLRWATLGGQYDWTNKVYPSSTPPAFPGDVKSLVEKIFPMKAEAAIVNLYSPGDTLSLHRDVSEECDRPLVSISLGCDAIFVCGLDSAATDGDGDETRVATLRLCSGDAVLMSGESRYAWHGVPKVISKTCPGSIENWPAQTDSAGEYEKWRGWMKDKRINLNIRQMFA